MALSEEHGGEFSNLSRDLPREDSEFRPFRDVIPDSSLPEVAGSHILPEANWSIQQVRFCLLNFIGRAFMAPKDLWIDSHK
jgi:hypothetical protein